MFATDRDLLVLEPHLFRDHAWLGQRLVSGSASISSSTLTFSSLDSELDVAQVAPGCVATIADASFELLQIIDTSSALLSRLRAASTDPQISVGPIDESPAWIHSFRPQIALVHRQVLRLAGIEPDAPQPAGRLTESNITNGAALIHLESLGALHLIYSAAAAIVPPSSPFAARAAIYLDLFRSERQRAVVELDADNDGLPDATRRLNVVQFLRT